MKHLDLFSGIGGFALATEMVWDNVEHIFCDNEPFAQAIIKKHWPNSYIHNDIRTLTNTRCEYGRTGCSEATQGTPCQWCRAAEETQRFGSIDVLTGGFPCQPFSQAGARRGTEDSRHLWPEMLRIIREFHPRWVIGENVGGLVTWSEGLVLEQIHTDLEGEGYEVQAFIIPAVSVNAPHRRDRVWIAAFNSQYARLNGTKDRKGRITRSDSDAARTNEDEQPSRPAVSRDTVTNSKSVNGKRCNLRQRKEQFRRSEWECNWVEVATRLCRVDDGIPRRLDRNSRLKGLGNAIVPQVAAEIMRAIKEIDDPSKS